MKWNLKEAGGKHLPDEQKLDIRLVGMDEITKQIKVRKLSGNALSKSSRYKVERECP